MDPPDASGAVRPFGDSAVLIDAGSLAQAQDLAAAVTQLAPSAPGIEDVVVGDGTVTVIADPRRGDVEALVDELARLHAHRRAGSPRSPGAGGSARSARGGRGVARTHGRDGGSGPSSGGAGPGPGSGRPGSRVVTIPVAFDGPDLAAVAAITAMSPAEVVGALVACRLQVAFLGFSPGFAYLVGLPPALAAVPRRSVPRPVVPAGSVALGGGFAGIYPQATPGGWHLVGTTAVTLFDPDTPPYALLRPGDTVRLVPTERSAALQPETQGRESRPPETQRSGPSRPVLVPQDPDARRVEVLDPGALTLVEDLGRTGVAHLGVPRAGAADAFALRAANRLVGNAEDAAGLEVTVGGPVLRFAHDAHVVLHRLPQATLDGRPLPPGVVVPVRAGQVLTTGPAAGARGYVVVGGGFDVPAVLGSRSSDVLCGLGIGPLHAGDTLGLGTPGRPRGGAMGDGSAMAGRHPSGPGHGAGHGGPVVVRVLPGPDVDAAALDMLAGTEWQVGPHSDRIGVRLHAPAPRSGGRTRSGGSWAPSRGMVTGAVQLPPSGHPVVLLADHATVGGYPVPATVVSADIGVLACCRPGDAVRFELVDRHGALAARRAVERAVAATAVGWYPVAAG